VLSCRDVRLVMEGVFIPSRARGADYSPMCKTALAFTIQQPETACHPLTEQAIRLSPRDPQLSSFFSEIGRVHLLESRTDEAIPWLEKARNATPAHSSLRAWLASAYALKGETERAVVELAEARRLSTGNRFSSIAQVKEWYWTPTIGGLLETTFLAGLRKAGVPEE
jgi:adenylate cyclase